LVPTEVILRATRVRGCALAMPTMKIDLVKLTRLE
jgi:hypothetical protein